MGFERLVSILQDKSSNYDTDVFSPLFARIQELTGARAYSGKLGAEDVDGIDTAYRVVADHIRTLTFAISDGCIPDKDGRGYVLRRILRRGTRFVRKYFQVPIGHFFSRLVPTLVEQMGDFFPEITKRVADLQSILDEEERSFARTLDRGEKLFEQYAHAARAEGRTKLSGTDVWRLYDTYGFPLDLTQDMARERGMSVDVAGFDAAMTQQKETARAAGKFGGGTQLPADLVAKLTPTRFLGYDALTAGGLQVLALLKDGKPVDAVAEGDEAIVILDATPFYGESGGQVGDVGELDGQGMRFAVSDTLKLAGQFHGHVGNVRAGGIKCGDHVLASVDGARRAATVLNHSATHLLHAALRDLLGTHVQQKGSLVAPDRLRFDFSHFQPVTAAELAEIERRVNAEVRANHEGEVRHMGMQDALDFGAIALFGEKYGEEVRVLRFGPTSTELCGGTHVGRTGDIGLFKIVSEGGVSAGVRRIEAVTGQGALDYVAEEERRLNEVAAVLGGTQVDVADKLRSLLERQKKLERELDAIKAKAASGATSDLGAQAQDVAGIKVLAARLEGFDAKALRDAMDRLKQQLGDAVIVLAGVDAGKAALVAGVSGGAAGKVKAGELLADVARQVNGKGGGRPDMAQGGGEDSPQLMAALDGVPAWVAGKLGS